MSTKTITRLIMGITIFSLIALIFWFQYNKQNQHGNTVQTEKDVVPENELSEGKKEISSTDRLGDIEDELKKLNNKIEKQEKLISQITKETNSSDTETTENNKKVLAVAQSKVNSFSTTSSAYTSMGSFSNIACLENCYLWINFYAISSNDSGNNTNTYGLFVDGVEQNTYSQATITTGGSTESISLNAVIPVSAGTHTVEIKSKTTGGTLTSHNSSLQIMAINN